MTWTVALAISVAVPANGVLLDEIEMAWSG
jgi:hypothetical protein